MAFREGRCGEGKSPYGWGAENAGIIGVAAWEGRSTFPATTLCGSRNRNLHYLTISWIFALSTCYFTRIAIMFTSQYARRIP